MAQEKEPLMYEMTWDELADVLVKARVPKFYDGMHAKIAQYLYCKLKIVATRYYLVFDNADDFIFFRLKYL